MGFFTCIRLLFIALIQRGCNKQLSMVISATLLSMGRWSGGKTKSFRVQIKMCGV